MASAKRVVLFYPYPDPRSYPTFAGVHYWAPLSLMAVGGYLLRRGCEVVLIDQRHEGDPLRRVMSELEGSLCLGVSTITGASISEGLKVSEEVKKSRPKIPIVWGGQHPTLLPEQTVKHPAVDIVVRGQGEVTMWELVKTLANNGDLREVKGLTFKEDGRVLSTPPRPIADINDFPPVSYSLVEVEKYLKRWTDIAGIKAVGGRKPRAISYISSFGCPYNCRFCSENVISRGRWLGLQAGRVVKEIRHLVEGYGVEMVVFADNNFFVNPSRVIEICNLILDQDIPVLWVASSRSDTLARFSDSEVKLLYRSGCRGILVGAESASQKTLDLLNKRSKPEDTEVATRIFTANGITINLNYMLVLPDEAPESPWKTSRQSYRLASHSDLVTLTYFFYRPYPGTGMFERAVELGFHPPRSLAGWASVVAKNINLATVDAALFRKFDLLRFMFMSRPKPGIRNLPRNVVVLLLRISAWIRLRLKTFALPLDLFVMNMVARRKPGARRAMSVEA